LYAFWLTAKYAQDPVPKEVKAHQSCQDVNVQGAVLSFLRKKTLKKTQKRHRYELPRICANEEKIQMNTLPKKLNHKLHLML
jgi:hypothetical protein